MPMPHVFSTNISAKTGERKTPVKQVELVADMGVRGDAHAGVLPDRQVSLLAMESIRKMQRMGLDVKAGDFAENITTEGIALVTMAIGTRLRIGEALVEISRIGKECHNRCAIYDQAGDCVMPKEGVFARVVQGGIVRPGDAITHEDFITEM
jgi:MOSC domain-containing protein YiiM